MSGQWRLFLAALRFGSHLPAAAFKGTELEYPGAAARYFPVAGALVGALGGGVYWLATQLWPTSIAVVLAMLATTPMSGWMRENNGADQPAGEPAHHGSGRALGGGGRALGGGGRAFGMVGFVFALLLKYNALMALSAAGLPFAAPANAALGLIMICGHAASYALVVSLIMSPTRVSSTPITNGDLSLALGLGFVPAALLGIPGLIALVAAILARVGYGAYLRHNHRAIAAAEIYAARQLTEVCFYLGALASWTYV
jgi:adenosylcobinamide-GDP ribazoletransferase